LDQTVTHARFVRFALPLFVLVAVAAAPALAGSPEAAAPAAADPQATPLHWHPVGDEEVLADREGKPILYFFTADWCAPCHVMKRTLFADPEKASRISQQFVPVEVQDTRIETGENSPEVDEVIERYGVRSLPTMVVALPDGREIGQHRGYSGEERAWRWLTQQAMLAESHLDEK
jgi:protein disulfide-isomerase